MAVKTDVLDRAPRLLLPTSASTPVRKYPGACPELPEGTPFAAYGSDYLVIVEQPDSFRDAPTGTERIASFLARLRVPVVTLAMSLGLPLSSPQGSVTPVHS